MRKASYFFSVVLACFLSIYAVFYWQINSHLSSTFGDDLDTIIQATLISHWYGVFAHLQPWNSPLYFFPHTGVLGYNDGYFLNGLVASVFRLAGANFLAANELCLMVFRALGFLSMVALLNRLQPRGAINLFSAALFTLAISVANQAGHGQLFSVSFAPLLALLLFDAVAAVSTNSRRAAFLLASGFFILFNALLLSSFYMAWFFGLFLILFVAARAVTDFASVKGFVMRLLTMKVVVAGALAVFVVTVIPFFLVYLPTLRATGGQGYADQLAYSLQLRDILNTGDTSYLWGRMLQSLSDRFVFSFRDGEFRVGLTPDVFIVFLAIIICAAVKPSCFSKTFRALILATCVGFLLPIAINHHSLWFFVNQVIPGARGMRVIARFYLFLGFPLAVLAALFAGETVATLPRFKGVAIVVLLVLCVSQIKREPEVKVDAIAQITRLAAIPAPPSSCKSFFATNPAFRETATDRKYRQNVDAMAVADRFGVPTLNGVASFEPADWVFEDTPSYLQNVGLYIQDHQLEGVCSLNLSENRWELADPVRLLKGALAYQIGPDLKFSDPHDIKALASGWSTPEPWGVWSDGDSSTIVLETGVPIQGDLKLIIDARAFLTAAHTKLDVKVTVNGVSVGTIGYGGTFPAAGTRTVLVNTAATTARSGLIVIKLDYAAAKSPAELGLSQDHRKLGIGIMALRLERQ